MSSTMQVTTATMLQYIHCQNISNKADPPNLRWKACLIWMAKTTNYDWARIFIHTCAVSSCQTPAIQMTGPNKKICNENCLNCNAKQNGCDFFVIRNESSFSLFKNTIRTYTHKMHINKWIKVNSEHCIFFQWHKI